ncbi:MAG: hypothetical protein ABR608_06215, partial [Pseudonocardiaceae bacterium]
ADQWTGAHQRGVQLHDLGDAVRTWVSKYGQRAWLRQLTSPIPTEMEDAVLRCIARLDGTPFPSTARMVARWALGRLPQPRHPDREQSLDTAYCAEIVALTYQTMGLLPTTRRAQWYDAGRFWSGDDLDLTRGYALGEEIAVEVPTPPGEDPVNARRSRRRGRLVRQFRRFPRRGG